MSGLKSLELAVDVATRKRDEADKIWMQTRRAMQRGQEQLDQLKTYASDTETRWATATATSISAELMQHQRSFLQRLQQAIGMQGDAVADMQAQVEAARQRRLQEEVHLAALEQLLKRRRDEQARLRARQEQKQTDELAALRHSRGAAQRDPSIEEGR